MKRKWKIIAGAALLAAVIGILGNKMMASAGQEVQNAGTPTPHMDAEPKKPCGTVPETEELEKKYVLPEGWTTVEGKVQYAGTPTPCLKPAKNQ